MARRLLDHAMPKITDIARRALEARTGHGSSVAFSGLINAATDARNKVKEVRRRLNKVTRCASRGDVTSLDQAVADLKASVNALNSALSSCR